MAGRDEIKIRFVKPRDSGDEGELESSYNLSLPESCLPKGNDTTPAQMQTEPSRQGPGQNRLRLAVSGISMKLAQHVQEKINTPADERQVPQTTAQPSAKLKKIALDVSQKVHTWGLEQQKLASGDGSTSKSLENDNALRVRSSSCSEKSSIPNNNFLFITDSGSERASKMGAEAADDGMEVVQCEEVSKTPRSSVSHSSSGSRLKSMSFNEGLSQISYSKSPNSVSIPPFTTDEDLSHNNSSAQLPILIEQAETTESPLSLKRSPEVNPIEKLKPADTEPEVVNKKPTFFHPIISSVKSLVRVVIGNKFFPVVFLALCVFFLRSVGFPDILVGTVVGTYVTWFIFVYQPTISRKNSSPYLDNDLQCDHSTAKSSSSKTVETTALMHFSYSYNPCTFRLRYSHLCSVSLNGSMLTIGILDRKSSKEIKSKFSLEYSPCVEHLQSLTYSEQYCVDLTAFLVALVPAKLARKRYFNKKYPIWISRKSELIDISMGPTEKSYGNLHECFLFTLGMREKESWFTALSCTANGLSLKAFDLLPIKRVNATACETVKERRRDVVRLSKLRNSVSLGNMGDDVEPSSDCSYLENQDLLGKKENSPDGEGDLTSLFRFHYVSRREQLRWFLSQATVIASSSPLGWFNAFAWRVFFEIMTVDELKSQLQGKMQGKLHKIILPRIIEPLRLSELSLGCRMPLFKEADPPTVDDLGLWLTFHVEYDGGLQGTIETRVNLLKAKQTPQFADRSNLLNASGNTPSPSPSPCGGFSSQTPDLNYLEILACEDAESFSSSSESDDDSADPMPSSQQQQLSSSTAHNTSGHLIERVTSSRYFARLIAIGSVGRAAERVSLVPLTLRIEVNRIAGKMRINLPPPPSDRIWIGFCDDGLDIDLALRPKVGNLELSGRTLQPIVSYLERKIVAEFKKKLVLPSMDDFYLGFFRDSLLSSDRERSSTPIPDANPSSAIFS